MRNTIGVSDGIRPRAVGALGKSLDSGAVSGCPWLEGGVFPALDGRLVLIEEDRMGPVSRPNGITLPVGLRLAGEAAYLSPNRHKSAVSNADRLCLKMRP